MFDRLKRWCGLVDNGQEQTDTVGFLREAIKQAEAEGDQETAQRLKEHRKRLAEQMMGAQ